MEKQLRLSRICSRPSKSVLGKSTLPVQQGCSISPSEISTMHKRGLAISAQLNDELFYDGDDSRIIDVPIERLRGVDVNDIWNASQDAKKKLLNAHQNDVKLYGN